MSEKWDDYAEGWDSNQDVIAYSRKAFKSLTQKVDLSGIRVLDFGCGTGLLAEQISPIAKEVVALDPSEKMISILSNKHLQNVTAVREALSEDLITDNGCFSEKFDLIVASSVCSFLPDYEKTLSLLKSILVPGGLFVQWDWQATEAEGDSGLSRERVISAYEKSGLTLETLEQPFSMDSPDGSMPVLMGVAKNSV